MWSLQASGRRQADGEEEFLSVSHAFLRVSKYLSPGSQAIGPGAQQFLAGVVQQSV